jgi:predicted ArsR family transcriptional regulator
MKKFNGTIGKGLIAEASGLLGIPFTGKTILLTLANSDRALSIQQLKKKTKKSERAIRAHLKALTEMGLVKKRINMTRRRRAAHFYSLHFSGFTKSVREEISRRLHRLERYVNK